MEITLGNYSDWQYVRFEEAMDIGVFLQPGNFRRLADQAAAVRHGAALRGVCQMWKAAGATGTIKVNPIPFPSIYSGKFHSDNEYQNEYQTDPGLFVPIGADTGRLLSKNQKNTPKQALGDQFRPPPPLDLSLELIEFFTERSSGQTARRPQTGGQVDRDWRNRLDLQPQECSTSLARRRFEPH